MEVQPGTITAAVSEAMNDLRGRRKSNEVIRWIENKYPGRFDPQPIQSQLRRCAVNCPGPISRHPGAPGFLYKVSTGVFELYEPEKHGLWDGTGRTLGSENAASVTADDLEEIVDDLQDQLAATREFAHEVHLRDYLARNVGRLEPGLTLWTNEIGGSVEYAVGTRRIDILARDKAGVPVIIELKVSRGHERTVGQALYYRGKLKENLSVPRVRIIMVAAEITEELRLASQQVEDVEIFSYALSMQLTKRS